MTGLCHGRQLLKNFRCVGSDCTCSLTSSKSEKPCTKLAILIITHLVPRLIYIRPCSYCELPCLMCKTVGASAIIFHVCLCRPAIVPTENIQILCFLCHCVNIAKKVRIKSCSEKINTFRMSLWRRGGPAGREGAYRQIRRQDDLIAQQAARTKEHSQETNWLARARGQCFIFSLIHTNISC